MEEKAQPEKKQLLKKFPKQGKQNIFLILGSLLVVLAGVTTGWLLSGRPQTKGALIPEDAAPGAEKTQTEAGVTDTEAYPDTAEGVLEEGGLEGEGTHHLVREGGPEKYVYLTSTAFNFEGFVGKKVQVWGETMSAKHAPWLMDVGRIKVLE